MRFTLLKNLKQESAMKPIMVSLLVFMLLYLILDLFVKEANFGLSYNSVLSTLYGDEDEFIDPMSKALFLEFIHVEIFLTMMVLLTLNAIFARFIKESRLNFYAIHGVMISALLSFISLGIAYFFSPTVVHLYIFTFFLWHGFAFYMILFSLWKLNAKNI